MNSSRFSAPALSANDAFKSQYQKYLRWSGLVAVLLTGLMVWSSPQYTPRPYRLRTEIMRITDVEVIPLIEDQPEIAAAPVIPPDIDIVDDDEPGIAEPVFPPDWNRFYAPAPTSLPVTGDGFVASSTKPRLVSQPKPYYPEVARLALVEGTVIVKVLVDVEGAVAAAEIVQSVHPLLDKAALKAARRCVFVPGQQRELRVPVWVAVPYNFRLH